MRLGIDLGGTKIEAVALDAEGHAACRLRVATPKGGYGAVLDAIATLIQRVEAECGPASRPIGMGIPGSVSPATGLIRNANSTVLNGRPFAMDLSARLARPVRLSNDANCFAIAEARAGAGQGAHLVLGLILGTGIGAGIAIGGAPWIGRNAIGGEWGHNPLPGMTPDEAPGPLCWCGRRGCIEAWCSGPAISRLYEEQTGEGAELPEIARMASRNPAAARVLTAHLDRLGRALASVVNILDPDVIVLGGGLSNLDHLPDGLAEAMRPHIFSDSFRTPIRRAALGDSAGVFGAAWLWPDAEMEERS